MYFYFNEKISSKSEFVDFFMYNFKPCFRGNERPIGELSIGSNLKTISLPFKWTYFHNFKVSTLLFIYVYVEGQKYQNQHDLGKKTTILNGYEIIYFK